MLRDLAIGCLLASVCFGIALAVLARDGSETLVRNGLQGQAEDLAEGLSSAPDAALHLALGDMQHGYAGFTRHLKYRVLDARGVVVLSSESVRDPLVRDGGTLVLRKDRFAFTRDGTSVQAVTIPANVDGDRYWIQAARSDAMLHLAEEAIVPVVMDTALIAGGFAMTVFATILWWRLRRAFVPVRRASRAARSIGPRTPGMRLPVAGMPSEILPLVDTVNDALDRLEAAYIAQQHFLANAAHELKTPLTILRGRWELRDDATPDALQDIDQMARIVTQMLHLAEASDPASYRIALPVDLREVAARAIAQVQFAADRKHVAITVSSAPAQGSPPEADAAALTMAARNVLENAIRYSPAGGRIEVVVSDHGVCVHDEGPGLPDGLHDQVFARFWRGDRHGDGAGLGLAIVREVMQAHGGTAEAANRCGGTGATFRLRFPVPAAGRTDSPAR